MTSTMMKTIMTCTFNVISYVDEEIVDQQLRNSTLLSTTDVKSTNVTNKAACGDSSEKEKFCKTCNREVGDGHLAFQQY